MCFENNRDKKARTEALIAGIREGRKKELIQKHIETLMEFDEDLLDIAEVLLVILKGMSLAEGIWLMNLVSAAMHYPDIFFKEWLGKVDNRELISDSEQTRNWQLKKIPGSLMKTKWSE